MENLEEQPGEELLLEEAQCKVVAPMKNLREQSMEVLPLEGELPMVVAPVEFLEEQLGEELPLERAPSTPTALWEEFWWSNPSLNTGFKCQVLQSSLAAAWDLWLL